MIVDPCHVFRCKHSSQPAQPLDPMQRHLCARHVSFARVILARVPGTRRHELLTALETIDAKGAPHA